MSDSGTLGVVDRVIASTRLPLGAPGIYLLKEKPLPALSAQRMDVAAFAGVAPRGPAYVPIADAGLEGGWHLVDPGRPRRRSVAVAVASFDEYKRSFGGFEGPGLLAQSVASFFEQGGRRAHVIRVVAPQADPVAGLAAADVTGVFAVPLRLLARDQGEWGNALTIQLTLARFPLRCTADGAGLLFDRATDAPIGTLLQLGFASGARSFAFIAALDPVADPLGPVIRWRATLDPPPAQPPATADAITATLTLRDGAGLEENFIGLGLDPGHPRWLASVLCEESRLAWPGAGWAGERLLPAGPAVESLRSAHPPFAGGDAFYGAITAEHFFDSDWSPAEQDAGDGIAAIAAMPDPTQLVVPDLYLPAVWADDAPPPAPPGGGAGAVFADCITTVPPPVTAAGVPPSVLTGLILDPRQAGDLAAIEALQSRLVAFCEDSRALIALLDVPPGLTRSQAERWRATFDSSWCAAYHPWLRPARNALAGGATPRRMPPSAIAAGIVARKEIAAGVQAGPANEIANGIIDLAEPVGADLADAFHPQGMNCFLRDIDGIRLIGARTLSRDAQWRQLSVRRLMLMLRRTLLREMQWAVFEPNGTKLARDLRHAIEGLLRRLFRAGAFVGNGEAEAFFVRIAQERALQDIGEIIVEIGVAPVEPLEFLLLRLRRQGDGSLALEG